MWPWRASGSMVEMTRSGAVPSKMGKRPSSVSSMSWPGHRRQQCRRLGHRWARTRARNRYTDPAGRAASHQRAPAGGRSGRRSWRPRVTTRSFEPGDKAPESASSTDHRRAASLAELSNCSARTKPYLAWHWSACVSGRTTAAGTMAHWRADEDRRVDLGRGRLDTAGVGVPGRQLDPQVLADARLDLCYRAGRVHRHDDLLGAEQLQDRPGLVVVVTQAGLDRLRGCRRPWSPAGRRTGRRRRPRPAGARSGCSRPRTWSTAAG